MKIFVYNYFCNMTKKDKKQVNYLEEWKKERASFLNYKASESSRIEDAIAFSNQNIISKVIDILDNMALAENNLPSDLENNEWVKGILQTKNKILEFLKGYGVEELEFSKEFDPNIHEAVEVVESAKDSGMIVEVIQPGYTLNNKIIRPAKVKIAK